MPLPAGWKPIGRYGEMILCVLRGDHYHPLMDAIVYDERTGKVSGPRALGIWLKFGVYEPHEAERG